VTPPTTFSGGVGALSGDLARYWEHWAEHGRAPSISRFDPGFWTTEQGLLIWQAEKKLTANGIRDHYRFTPGQASDGWAVPGRGYEIACGSLVDQVTMTRPKGYLTQPTARDEFPAGLAPGSYSKIIETDLSSPCFDVFPTGNVFPFGAALWPVSVEGDPLRGS
jgi:hypothetical protein